LTATSMLDTQIDLRWTPATDNVAVTGYRVYRDGAATPVASLPGTTTSYADRQLAPLESHSYAVTALDAAGNQSAVSNTATARTPLFGDGFESGNLSRWTSVVGLTTQTGNVFAGTWGAQAQGRGSASYAVKQLPASFSTVDFRLRLKILSGKPDVVDVLRLRTAAGANLVGLRYDSKRKLAAVNHTTGLMTTSSTGLAVGTWYELRVRLTVEGALSRLEVRLNGARVDALSSTAPFGTTPIGQVVVGEPDLGHEYSFALDDVVADTTP
jgi:hypothetical protein